MGTLYTEDLYFITFNRNTTSDSVWSNWRVLCSTER